MNEKRVVYFEKLMKFFSFSFQVEAFFQREALRLNMSQLVERVRCSGFKRRNNAVGWADFLFYYSVCVSKK